MKEKVKDDRAENLIESADDISNAIVDIILGIESVSARSYIPKIVKQKLLMIESSNQENVMNAIKSQFSGMTAVPLGDIFKRTGGGSPPNKTEMQQWVKDIINDSADGSGEDE